MNNSSEFEFVEESANEMQTEFVESENEFEKDAGEIVDKSEVIIYANNRRIRGKIALVPGADLTEHLNDARSFIAVTDVEIRENTGKLILKTPFLNLSRDDIEIVLLAKDARLADAVS